MCKKNLLRQSPKWDEVEQEFQSDCSAQLYYWLTYIYWCIWIVIDAHIRHPRLALILSLISALVPSGSYPSPKAGATLVMHKDLLVLFGGWTRPSPYPLHQPERFFDEIHTYSPSKNWWERKCTKSLGCSYVELLIIAVLFILVAVVFFLVSFFPLRWNCIVTTHGPPPMAGHSSSVIGNTMVVFGGSLGARQMYNYIITF